MNNEQLHILQHSLGLDKYGQGEQYRNSFVTGKGSKDFDKCNSLVVAGFMVDHGPQKLAAGSHFFRVTPAGVDAVALESPEPPKLTRGQKRYQEYLKNADCFESFRDFLRYDTGRRQGLYT